MNRLVHIMYLTAIMFAGFILGAAIPGLDILDSSPMTFTVLGACTLAACVIEAVIARSERRNKEGRH
ncbi:hypothetical protein [Arcanobacterium canis]